MSKYTLELDRDALLHARLTLGTETFAETVNEALRRVTEQHDEALELRLDALAGVRAFPEADTWTGQAA